MFLTRTQTTGEYKEVPAQALQNSLFLSEKLYPGHTYHRITAVEIKGAKLDIARFRSALKKLIMRHEALRSYFVEKENGIVHQRFISENQITVPFTLIDALSMNDPLPLNQVSETLATLGHNKFLTTPFALMEGPLWRCALIQFSDDHYQLVMPFHHIIVDLVSEGVILRELSIFYNQPETTLNSLPKLPLLSDIVQSDEKIAENMSYWKERLKNLTPFSLKPDHRATEKFCFRGDRAEFILDKDLADQLEKLAKSQNVSMHMTLFAGLFALLHRYTGQTDICLGTVSANRRHPNQKNTDLLVNCLINSVPVRIDISKSLTFSQLLQQVKTSATEAYKNQVPFDILNNIKSNCIGSVFNTMFAYSPEKTTLNIEGACVSQPIDPNLKFSRFENFGLNLDKDPSGYIAGYFEFNTDLFSHEFMTRIRNHFVNALQQVVTDPTKKLSDLVLLSPDELKQIENFNSTTRPDKSTGFITQLLAKQVRENPDQPAFVFHTEDRKKDAMSYAELDRDTDALASVLSHFKCGPNVPVGICLSRSLLLMTGIYGTFKAGSIAVPVETKPDNRRSMLFKLKKTKTNIVLVDNQTQKLFSEEVDSGITLVNIEDKYALNNLIHQFNLHYKAPDLQPDHVAYITYTSGTTAEPKGIEITYRSLNNAINALLDREFKPGSGILLTAPPTFDAFFFELFEALVTPRSKLHFIFEEGRLDPTHIANVINNEKISMATLTPRVIRQLEPEKIPSLQYLISMGDVPDEEVIKKWLGTIQNEYGPAEGCMFSTSHPCRSGEPHTNIGTPIRNCQIFILDEYGNLCPPGIAGKIFLGGTGLAKGYINDPEKTLSKFVLKKFNSAFYRFENPLDEKDPKNIRLYDTGDIGTYLSEKNAIYGVNFGGRHDRQVKLKSGLGINLDSIENELRKHPEIKDITVIQNSNNKELLAFFTQTNSNQKIYTKHLNTLLSKTPLLSTVRLYGAVHLPNLPINSNGKLDSTLLPDYKRSSNEISDPKTKIQTEIRIIWAKALKISETSFGVDQWFSEVGGDSFNLLVITQEINKMLKIPLKIREIFPTFDTSIEEIENRIKPYLKTQDADTKFSAAVQPQNCNDEVLDPDDLVSPKEEDETELVLSPTHLYRNLGSNHPKISQHSAAHFGSAANKIKNRSTDDINEISTPPTHLKNALFDKKS